MELSCALTAAAVMVLIDTCPQCFNRYMVECEFGKAAEFTEKYLVLIDTWWNVNSDLFLSFLQVFLF